MYHCGHGFSVTAALADVWSGEKQDPSADIDNKLNCEHAFICSGDRKQTKAEHE